MALTHAEGRRVVHRSIGEALAEAVREEVAWLERYGLLPGGLAWDDQPAWRVRLWTHCLATQERAGALAAGML